MTDFFTFGVSTQDKNIYRADELLEIGGKKVSYRQVGSNLKGKAIQLIHERIKPGADTGKEMLRHEAEEGGFIVKGQIELTIGGQVEVLNEGDAYYFDSRIPHRFRNICEHPCEIISACTPPSF